MLAGSPFALPPSCRCVSRLQPLRAIALAAHLAAFLGLAALPPTPAAADEAAQAPTQAAPATVRAPEIVPARFAATKRQVALLRVEQPGRYALVARSDQGTGLQLVDRRSGPGAVFGVPGAEDGRIDAYLDRGEYRLIAFGAEGAKGEVQLEAKPFQPLEAATTALPELRLVTGELGDLEERSYWFRLPKQRRVILEAAGRHLGDLRLWRDGGWLVEAEPEILDIEPVPGRQLRHLRLAVELPAGLYRVSAVGGPGLPWADDDGTKPIYLRWGWPKVGEAARGRHEISPFGADHYLVPQSASYFRLEASGRGLPVGPLLRLELNDFYVAEPFRGYDQVYGEITKETNPPVVELYQDALEAKDRFRLATVRGTPGESYVLQHFNNERTRVFTAGGAYWISSVHSGDAGDALDATGVLTRWPQRAKLNTPVELVSADVIELTPGMDRRRKFNLDGQTELFLHVAALGEWEFSAANTGIRVQPFAAVNQGVRVSEAIGVGTPPRPQYGTAKFELDPGYYVLTLMPPEAEIGELRIRSLGGPAAAKVDDRVHPAAQLGVRQLDLEYRYAFYLNQQPGRESGSVLRSLPLDLTEPLPVQVGLPITVPSQAPVAGRYRAVGEGDVLFEVATGGAFGAEVWVEPGVHQVSVRRADGQADPLPATLLFEARDRVADQPLPPLPGDVLSSLPVFPLLDARDERYFDLAAKGEQTFLLQASEPALYRVESLGLLDTSGSLRTTLQPRLASADSAGSGRNFLLQEYLRPGDYQLTVRADGRSQGRAGVRLTRTAIGDGGELWPGSAARSALAPGEAAAYRFQVAEAGRFRLRALALGKILPVRLEDAEGWPIVAPGTAGDLEVDLERGAYRLIVLPTLVGARQVVRLDALPREAARQGHGPHALPFGRTVRHRWLEPAEGAPRLPDRWTFELPAPVLVRLELNAEMAGQIVRRVGEGFEKVADVLPGRPFQGELPAGQLELQATCSRRNNQVDYQIRLEPQALIAGHRLERKSPAEIPLALGAEGLVELTSFGPVDVRFQLLDMAGQIVAAADDRPGDWNFQWTGRLAAGSYRLKLDHVGPAGATEVAMRLPAVRENAAQTLPLRTNVQLGAATEILPLKLPADAGALVAKASAAGFVRLALEEQATAGGRWTTLASRDGRDPRLVLWPRPGAAYRLRLEPLARGDLATALRAELAELKPLTEAAIRAGARVRASSVLGNDLGVVALRFDRPGCFRIQGGAIAETLTAPGQAGGEWPEGQPLLAAPEASMLLAVDPRQELRLQRWAWAGEEVSLLLPADGQATCDLQPGTEWRLLTASALKDQPSVAEPEALAAQAVGAASAVTVLPPGATRFAVRGMAGQPLKLRSVAVPAPAAEMRALGGHELELPARSARVWTLPAGAKQFRLLLDPGLGARLEGGGEPPRVFWADPTLALPLDVVAEGMADRLTVVNATEMPGRHGLELLPLPAIAEVRPGQPFERPIGRAGLYELRVAGGAGRLHVRGGDEATFLGTDGSVGSGRDFAVPADGGRLQVAARSGLLWAWTADARAGLAGLWPALPLATGEPLVLPAVVALDQPLETFEIDLGAPGVLHLRSEAGGVTAVELPGETQPAVAAFGAALSQDLYLPRGKARVAIRRVGEGMGRLEATASTVTPVGEGLGPEVLLGPGQSRFFVFEVPASRLVGWAARADAGVVEGRLLAADGRELRQAAADLRELAPGKYLLALAVPAAARPTRVRPVLVGLEERSTLPPAELIARYVRGDLPLPGEQTEALSGEAEGDEAGAGPREVAPDESGEIEDLDGGEGEGGEGEGGDEEGAGDESYDAGEPEEGGGEGR